MAFVDPGILDFQQEMYINKMSYNWLSNKKLFEI